MYSLSSEKAILISTHPFQLECVRAIHMFMGKENQSLKVLENINSPINAINLQSDAHSSFAKLNWGIEAKEDDDKKVRC